MAEPTKTVAAVAPDGTPIEIPASAAASLTLGQEGHVMSPAEEAATRHQLALQEKYGGVEGYIAPPLVGAARGLSFGLSDQALAGLGLRSRLQDYEEFAPQALEVGEIAGMVGGALTGVGAPALAEAAGVRAAGALGARGLGGAIVRGGIEGAMFGAGDAISEAALSDHGLSAEALIGGAGYGALGGAVASGVLHGVGTQLGKLGRRATADGLDALAANKYGEAAPGVGRKLAEVEAAAIDADAGLAANGPGAGRAIMPDGSTDYASITRRVPLSDIDVPPVWDPSKMPPLRAAREAGVELDAIKLGRMSEEGPWNIVDGIHRANVAAERGESDILARYTAETKPQRLNDDIYDFSTPLDTSARPIDIGALRGEVPKPPTLAEVTGSPYRTPGTRGIADDVAETYIANRPVGTSAERSAQSEAWAHRDRVFAKNAETVENASRTWSNALDDALKAGREVDMASFGEAKVNHMSKLVDSARAPQQAERVYNWLLDADPLVKSLSSDVNSAMTKSDLRQWNGWVAELASAIEKQDSMQMHTSLDAMKRWVGKQAEFGKGPFGLSRAAREFDELYQGKDTLGGLKGLLEDDVWGARAASAQRDVNAATANFLSEGKRFSRNFTTEFGSDAGRPLYAADTAKVSSFMNKLTSASNDLDARSAEQWIAARRHFLDATAKSYEHTPATMAAVQRERAALDKLDSVYRQTTKDVTLANQVRAALAEERERGIGGAIGAVFDIAAKPYTTLQRLAQVEAQTKGIIGRINGGAGEMVGTKSAAAARAAATGRLGGFFSNLLDGLKQTAPTAASAGGAITSRALFTKRAEQIGALQGNPIAVTDRVARSLSGLDSAAPNVTRQASEVAMRGIDFLATKLPPSRQDQFSLQPQLQVGSRASDAEISRFMRYAQAVDDPLIVFREAKKGTLTRDHVEAVQAVYPKLYDEIRGSVMRSLIESKTELPYARRLQLGILLDIPADKTLSPDFQRAIQATFTSVDQAGAESPPMTGAPPQIAGSLQTATQRAVEPAG